MMLSRIWASVCFACLLAPSATLAQNKPTLDQVFQSLHQNGRGETTGVNWLPFALLVVAGVLMFLAVKHWNRRQSKPAALNSHSKLVKEAAAAAGLSRRQMKSLESLARAQGFSSPLVAVICPSAISTLAKNVKTKEEKQAVAALAKAMIGG